MKTYKIIGNKIMYKNKQVGIHHNGIIGFYKPLGNKILAMLGFKQNYCIEYEVKESDHI